MTTLGVESMVVAEHLRWLRNKVGATTTPMHVLKLTYIAHGWMLGFFREPLVREVVEAWKYGPVIPELYQIYSVFGKQHIAFPVYPKEDVLGSEQLSIIETVERSYLDFSALELSSKTHEPGSPWDKAVRNGV